MWICISGGYEAGILLWPCMQACISCLRQREGLAAWGLLLRFCCEHSCGLRNTEHLWRRQARVLC